MKKIVFNLIAILDKIIPKNNNTILYFTFPDLTDNGFAFFTYISNNHPKYRNIWLINHTEKTTIYDQLIRNYTSSTNYTFIKKHSLTAIYYYLRCKFIFITHPLFKGATIANKHCLVNLWHGMPVKNIGMLDGKKFLILQKQKYLTATSKYYRDILHNAFGTKKENILITGQARNDFLFINKNFLPKLGINKMSYQKVIIWLPTYRSSATGEVRADGKKRSPLPVLNSSYLSMFNSFLQEKKVLCIVKLHPMDSTTKNDLSEMSNIMVIDNDAIESVGGQLNSIIGECDILITDYSSVFIDFMLLKKPIILLADDIEEYEANRGFVESDINSFMPVAFTKTYIDLISTLQKILDGNYKYKYRNQKLFNEVEKGFSEKIFMATIGNK